MYNSQDTVNNQDTVNKIVVEYAKQMNEAYKEQEKSVRSLKTVIIGNRSLIMPCSSLVNSL